MAENRCTAQAERARRRQELEDTPMRRITVRPAFDRAAGCGCGCGCGCDALSELLTRQNQLLCEILAAVNSLTAARLADLQSK